MLDTLRAEVVAIGASAGGVEALSELVRHLPEDFPAPVVVVLHLAAAGTSTLPQILRRQGALPARPAAEGDVLAPGEIYVAPADHHARVRDGRIALGQEPRENGHRPAVDPLFRSVAECYGPRSVGVILSGAQDDGTSGLKAIKAAGGWALVQRPDTAQHPSMPTCAIANVAVDAVLDVAELALALAGLAVNGALPGRPAAPRPQIPEEVEAQ